MPSRTPTFAELLNLLAERAAGSIRVGLPGRVERYDSAKQLADVQPLVADQYEAEDGTPTAVRLPVITNVPVIFQGAGGMRITFPVQVGDTVWIMFSDRSLDAWLDQGGETQPTDPRRHHLSDAVCFPGLHSNNKPWSGAESGVITLGSDSGAADFVALNQKVLDALGDFASKFNGHTHTTPSGPSGTPTAAAVPTTIVAPANVGSATVKVKG